jgi:hypothetical protein
MIDRQDAVDSVIVLTRVKEFHKRFVLRTYSDPVDARYGQDEHKHVE